jgi:glycosyltransferase involved in cell wall biosynthesis
VDGGSDDKTCEIVQAFPNVQLILSEKGVSAQRNLGGEHCDTDVIVFLDSDTTPSPDFIDSLASQYNKSPFSIACPWFVPDTKRTSIRLFFQFMNTLFLLSEKRYHTGAGVCLITPKRIFKELGGFDTTLQLGEDIDYIQRAAKLGTHKHLRIPLLTSARRFEKEGLLKMIVTYAKVSPALLRGDKSELQKHTYPIVR